MVNNDIPTVDLTPFFKNEDEEEGKRKAKEIISHACSEYGFFQIVNHGVPPSLMARALELSKTFFELPMEEKLKSSPSLMARALEFSKTFFEFPMEEKLKSSPSQGAPIPAGFSVRDANSPDKFEFFVMFPPGSNYNAYTNDPPELRKVMEEIFCHFTKTALVVESIVNDCLGLPPKLLQEFNNDRSLDYMVAFKYFPAREEENNGQSAHQDANCLSFVFGDAEGLEVLKDGVWIPVVPSEGSLIVNIADVIQVLSNNKFKSAKHRVVRQEGKSRHSYIFIRNLVGNKWVEPLPEFTKKIGEAAKYRGFFYKDYQEMRVRNKTHPPSRPEDEIDITHYAIPNLG